MIRLLDATTLALTKLRTHPIRTIVTTLIASLLFGALLAGSIISSGAFTSIETLSKNGLTSRYIVEVNPAIAQTESNSVLRDKQVIAKAKKAYEELVKQKQREASRLGLDYNQASDQPPFSETVDGEPRLSLIDRNGISQSLLTEKYGGHAPIDDAKLAATSQQYGAIKHFNVTNLHVARGSSLSILPGGREVFYDNTDDAELNAKYAPPIIDNVFRVAPPDLTRPFLFEGDGGWTPHTNTLPVILPQNIVEQILDLEKLPPSASTDQKIQRGKDIARKARGFVFQACYRNSASIDLIQQAVMQQKSTQASDNKRVAEDSSLIYALPDAAACANPNITHDTRTADQIKHDENQKVFDKKFGLHEEPKSFFVPFTIVGVSPVQTNSSDKSRGVADILQTLLQTTGVGQLVPEHLYSQLADTTRFADILRSESFYLLGNEDEKTRYVEFATATAAQTFIDEQSCVTQYDGTCKPAGRDYMAIMALSESAALNDLKSKAASWFRLAVIGVTALAGLLAWFAISRTIAEARHETAIFRAIGFKRIDISLIYVTYAIVISLLTALLAAGIGLLCAYLIDRLYAPWFTAQTQYLFGGFDTVSQFSLFHIDIGQVSVTVGACILSGLLGALIPLIRNTRRNPIKDMRSDS